MDQNLIAYLPYTSAMFFMALVGACIVANLVRDPLDGEVRE